MNEPEIETDLDERATPSDRDVLGAWVLAVVAIVLLAFAA